MDRSRIFTFSDGELSPVLARVNGRLRQRLADLCGAGFIRVVVEDVRCFHNALDSAYRRIRHTVAVGGSFRRKDFKRCRASLFFKRANVIHGAYALHGNCIIGVENAFKYVFVFRVPCIDGGFIGECVFFRDQLAARRSGVPTSEEDGRIALRRSGRAFGEYNVT